MRIGRVTTWPVVHDWCRSGVCAVWLLVDAIRTLDMFHGKRLDCGKVVSCRFWFTMENVQLAKKMRVNRSGERVQVTKPTWCGRFRGKRIELCEKKPSVAARMCSSNLAFRCSRDSPRPKASTSKLTLVCDDGRFAQVRRPEMRQCVRLNRDTLIALRRDAFFLLNAGCCCC